MLARSLTVAAELARRERLDCITLDGDQVNQKGAFTGGFIDQRRSRLEAHKAIKVGGAPQRQQQSRTNQISFFSLMTFFLLGCGFQALTGELADINLRVDESRTQVESACFCLFCSFSISLI